MSEFKITVVEVGAIDKHPNADKLGITKVFGGYPCVVALSDWKEGDRAVYCPIDSLLPQGGDARWAFLDKGGRSTYSIDDKKYHRVRAVKLRGTFSMGLLLPADADMNVGDDVQSRFGVVKYEPPEETSLSGDTESPAGPFPIYTDVEGLRRWPHVLVEGEEVVLTEKLHGASARALFRNGRLYVGSHRQCKSPPAEGETPNVWWKAAAQLDLATRLAAFPEVLLFGEVYGWVADLRYGHQPGRVSFAAFDALDLASGKYYDYDALLRFAGEVGVPLAPELYRGPWSAALADLAEGKTTIPGADHVREGVVIKPTVERWDAAVGRVVLKMHGQGYLLR